MTLQTISKAQNVYLVRVCPIFSTHTHSKGHNAVSIGTGVHWKECNQPILRHKFGGPIVHLQENDDSVIFLTGTERHLKNGQNPRKELSANMLYNSAPRYLKALNVIYASIAPTTQESSDQADFRNSLALQCPSRRLLRRWSMIPFSALWGCYSFWREENEVWIRSPCMTENWHLLSTKHFSDGGQTILQLFLWILYEKSLWW